MSSLRSSRASPGRGLQGIWTFPVVLGALLVVVVFLRTTVVPFFEGDTWWHLTTGEQILATKSFPTTDSYSFTVTGNEWIAYEWLGEVVMALAFRLGGLSGLFLLTTALGSGLVLLLFCYAHLRSRNWKAAFVACMAVALTFSVYFNLRPQLIGYLFFVVVLIVLEQFRRGRSGWLWVLPPMFVVWVNTHGSFVFGLLAMGVCWASGLWRFQFGSLVAEPWTARQRLLLIACILLCVVALTLTPYGTRLAAYPLEMALLQPVNTGTNGEFQPILFHSTLWKILLFLFLAFFAADIIRPLRYSLDEAALLILGVYAALSHRRFILLLVPLFVPLLARQLGHWVSDYDSAKDRLMLNRVLVAVMAVGIALSLQGEGRLEKRVAQKYPRGAVEYLQREKIPRPMLNEYDWGGYLTRRLGAENKVFIDGRADIYEYGGVLEDYLSITHLAPGALQLLQKYGVASCLVAYPSPLGTFLSASGDWEQVYRDGLSAIYVHKRSHPSVDRGVSNELSSP